MIEETFRLRMEQQPWRRRGLHISAVCRCEPSAPCFDHLMYLSDLREDANSWDAEGKKIKAGLLRNETTKFYLRLTDKENQKNDRTHR